jgi:hypothetical protein
MVECGPPRRRLTPRQEALLASAFRLLLDPGEPVAVNSLAAAAGYGTEVVHAELETLSQFGRVQWTDEVGVTGCLGLTLESTNHAILIDGALRHTWCPLDAFGILGALHATGWIDSRNPVTDRRFHIDIEAGIPSGPETPWVVFIAERGQVRSVIAEWCPLVNIFEDAQAARWWADKQGISGDCLTLVETARLGADLWAPRISADLCRSAGAG